MGKPATTNSGGICFAFPDVCLTPVPLSPPVPIPYPNIGQLTDVVNVSTNVFAGGSPLVHKQSQIVTTMGDEAGSVGGVQSGTIKGKVEFTTPSNSVKVNGQGVVRMFDMTKQNNGNAVGVVLGGVPTVLVGD